MGHIMLSLLLEDISTAMIVAILKLMSVDVENTYRVSADTDKDNTLCIDVVAERFKAREHEVTTKRVDYIVRKAVTGYKFNEPLLVC